MKRFLTLLIFATLSLSQIIGQSLFTINLKAFLEGPFNGLQMTPDLNSAGFIPLSQPFNQSPWNYAGNENVPVIPVGVIDWILVELRETAGDASTAYEDFKVARQAGFILSDGTIVSSDGISQMQFNLNVDYKLFAVLYHRNHLPVMSGTELMFNAGNYIFDFTTGVEKVYGGALAHKELLPGIWGMISSDGDANGQVNNADKNNVWKPQSGSSGYLGGDFNLNGQVNNIDKTNYWSENGGKSTQLPGPWSCGKPIVDIRDGEIYMTVQINNQCWMAENLNIGTMITGNNDQHNNGEIEKYCFNNISSNCTIYGGLYQWNEMMEYSDTPGSQGICPSGWHVPTDGEWCELKLNIDQTVDCSSDYFSGTDVGIKMKSTTGWIPNGNGTNSSGFNVFPTGYRYMSGSFIGQGNTACFWNSSTYDIYNAWSHEFHNYSASIYRRYYYNNCGYSVRCIQD